MAIRKNIVHLTQAEKDTFVQAVLKLKNTFVNPGAPNQISLYDQFVAIHTYVNSITQITPPLAANDRGHGGSGFLPWHRKFIMEYEKALQSMVPGENLTLPYWDWTDSSQETELTDELFMGPHGTTGSDEPSGTIGLTVTGTVPNEVVKGYFAFSPPGTPASPGVTGNTTPQPPWWAAAGLTSFIGWKIRSDLETYFVQGIPTIEGTALRRTAGGVGTFTPSGIGNDVIDVMKILNFETSGTNLGFSTVLEAGNTNNPSATPTTTTRVHGAIHGAVGGHMTFPIIAANDPIFFLHHCNVDRLWAMWQINDHQGTAFGPATSGNPQGHNLNDPMWPWVANPANYSSTNFQPNIVLPSFPAVDVKPIDMLDHRSLGYSYDTEVVLGVALDQTGSMTGPTPSAMGTHHSIKWDAAKFGVASLLSHCETLFDSLEAYVTVGVETFRTLPSGNTFTPIFTGTPYGLVKTGSSYSSAAFVSNIGAQPPDGSTPLGGALTDTETTLVRPPFSNLPANDNRYLAILTDGIENTIPFLNTLSGQPNPQFPDTMIFAMGLGIGGGSNGVDYNIIGNMVTKGKAAPSGVQQIYHGDDDSKITKFYSDSIAHTIDYQTSTDPIYELFPGEHVDTAFDVTDADSSIMITCQGYDYSDKNWDFCVVRPNGEHCADTTTGMHNNGNAVMELDPFALTSRMKNGGMSIILKRNGVDSSLWVGRWNLRAMYKMGLDMKMYMPIIQRIILPVGSPPVRGPLYARLNQTPKMRQAVRVIPRTAMDPFFQRDQAPTKPGDDFCEVSVNIYSKTTIKSSLEVDIKAPFAGSDFKIILKVSGSTSSVISNLNVVAARLVAPKHSIGNAFADLKIIPLEDRKKYLAHNVSSHLFNELQYLADYEQKKPGVFPIRDEIIVFNKVDSGLYHAKIGNNVFPGVHSMSVYLEGTITIGKDQKPQQFTRILQTEVGLGINPDPSHSKPNMSWLSPNKFLVSVTPTDKLGNIAAPARMPAPIITVNGIAVKGKHINPFTGEHQVEVTLEGKGIKLSSDGRSILEGEATIETNTCEKLVLKEGQKFNVGILVSGRPLVSSMQNIRQKKD